MKKHEQRTVTFKKKVLSNENMLNINIIVLSNLNSKCYLQMNSFILQ